MKREMFFVICLCVVSWLMSSCESQVKKQENKDGVLRFHPGKIEIEPTTLQQAITQLRVLKSRLNVRKDEFETTEEFELRKAKTIEQTNKEIEDLLKADYEASAKGRLTVFGKPPCSSDPSDRARPALRTTELRSLETKPAVICHRSVGVQNATYRI